MPLLSDDQLASLREQQKQIERCQNCTAQIWKNYSRARDEFFVDGHYPTCKDYDERSALRKY